jgi:APA family basic amino acid/polyamine antiporter
VLVIGIYFAINLAYLHVLSPAQMAGNKLVAGAVAGAALGASGETIVRVVITVSLLSACSACLLIASRVPYAMSADRLLPAAVSRVNERGTPVGSLLLSSAVALALILSGTFNQVLALAACFFVLNYTVSFTSLFVLRRREPATPRPYRAWGHPWSTGLLLLGSLGFLASQVAGDAPNSMRSLAILAVSYPAYRLVRAASRRAEAAADAAG